MATSRICSIDGCGKPTNARGWCSAHHKRWLRHGDPLAGRKTMNGDPGRFLADALTSHTDICLLWPFGRGHGGYAMFGDGRTAYGSRSVSRIICETIHGKRPSPKHESLHSCNNGHLGCINPRHLNWGTHLENMADMIMCGRTRKGERHHAAKLTEADVRKIRLLRGQHSQRALGEMFGVNKGTISSIFYGDNWGWLV